MIRGFLPDVSTGLWVGDHMPGADRARRRFPTAARLDDVLGRAGFTPHDVVNVAEPEGPRADEAVAWVEMMRHADSILTALTDAEIAQGIASLRRLGTRRLPALALSLLTASKR